MNSNKNTVYTEKPDYRGFRWAPKMDITVWELAKNMPMFLYPLTGNCPGPVYDCLPLEAQRHWEVTT